MPDQDIALGFYQIAKYNYYPGLGTSRYQSASC
jgi:TRAP-type mannitol/chloroaromatic compound transport system substrate-binding protein